MSQQLCAHRHLEHSTPLKHAPLKFPEHFPVLHQELAVAFSALGMRLNGVVTTLMVPLLRSLIAHQ